MIDNDDLPFPEVASGGDTTPYRSHSSRRRLALTTSAVLLVLAAGSTAAYATGVFAPSRHTQPSVRPVLSVPSISPSRTPSASRPRLSKPRVITSTRTLIKTIAPIPTRPATVVIQPPVAQPPAAPQPANPSTQPANPVPTTVAAGPPAPPAGYLSAQTSAQLTQTGAVLTVSVSTNRSPIDATAHTSGAAGGQTLTAHQTSPGQYSVTITAPKGTTTFWFSITAGDQSLTTSEGSFTK